jgi:predicted DNA-binding protein YlxM (UPF0122 family)
VKLTKEKLQKLYVEENRTQREIADLYGWNSTNSTRYYLKKFDIDKSEEKKQRARVRVERENIVKKHVGSIADFRKIVEDCKSVVEISKRTSIERNTVYTLLEHFEVDFKTRSEKLEELDDEQKLRRLYIDEDLTQQDIADKFNCSRGYVRKMLKKHGIEKSNILNGKEEKIKTLYEEKNYSSFDIAELLNCSQSAVMKKLQKMDVKTKSVSDYNYSERLSGEGNPFYGKTHTKESRKLMSKKQRKIAIQRIKDREGQVYPNYNPEACKLIEEYGEEHGYNFQHAENGGEYHIEELGYWVDGYDPEENVVIEVDEQHHFNENGQLCEKDKRRQREIEEHLDCKFVRLTASKYVGPQPS